MSGNQVTTVTKDQVWKHGTRGNNIEFANIKLLEKYEPNTHKLIEWKEGFVCQDHEYEYRVGLSRFGLWLSRKPLEQIQQTEVNVNDKPPKRPIMTEQKQEEKEPFVSVNTNYEIAELRKRVGKLEHIVKCMVEGYQST